MLILLLEWQLETIILPAKEAGYHMLALDSLAFGNYFGACGVWRSGEWVQLYADPADSKYRNDTLNWLQQVDWIGS